ncbi:MAG: NUDIX domain-containing protein [Sphingomonadales bacterium]|nr:NUDIX domain-containing protein [Sphingomonadales bacterium]MBK6706284.1 NUDIX domain-containing protein [Sphingomonadales bacterium]MBK9003604.1 NUDIX domain-containing protein [Sphingomonadales bacterium]MBK9268714.1 NUDIX domain-containing protein [Sphingomonadales bacterium]MBP6031780.1 NUDIX domain-containing protein [Sphingobium sp.]
MRNIVNALLLHEDKILLARRSQHRKAYPDRWSFPGGHVETGETIEDALSRELTEEIDVIPQDYELLSQLRDPNARADPVTYHLFCVRSWKGDPTIMDDEHTELRWFTLNEASSLSDLALEEYRPLFMNLYRE